MRAIEVTRDGVLDGLPTLYHNNVWCVQVGSLLIPIHHGLTRGWKVGQETRLMRADIGVIDGCEPMLLPEDSDTVDTSVLVLTKATRGYMSGPGSTVLFGDPDRPCVPWLLAVIPRGSWIILRYPTQRAIIKTDDGIYVISGPDLPIIKR